MKKNKKGIIYIAIIAIVICIAVVISFNYNKEGRFNSKKIVAKMLTSSIEYGPLEFQDYIYFPSKFKFSDELNSNPVGTVEPKNMNFIIYLFMNHKIVTDKTDSSNTHIRTLGDDSRFYSKSEFLENANLANEAFEKYSRFALCGVNAKEMEDIQIDKDILIKLEERYGEIKYNKEDFDKANKIYYIYANYLNTQDSEFIGCIMDYQGNLYYGNLSNKIDKSLADLINKLIY